MFRNFIGNNCFICTTCCKIPLTCLFFLQYWTRLRHQDECRFCGFQDGAAAKEDEAFESGDDCDDDDDDDFADDDGYYMDDDNDALKDQATKQPDR